MMGMYYICECCGNRKRWTITRKEELMSIRTVQFCKLFSRSLSYHHPFLSKRKKIEINSSE